MEKTSMEDTHSRERNATHYATDCASIVSVKGKLKFLKYIAECLASLYLQTT